MKKVYLSPSMQPENKYAYGGTNEEIECKKIAAACKEALERSGIAAMMATGKTLAERCKESDKLGADLHVPIHTNAYNGKVSGTRLFSYDRTGAGWKACNAIFNVLAPITPGESENVTDRRSLYEVKTPKAPTAYIEVEFHDVAAAAKWIVDNTQQIGEAIAHGICNYFGVAYVAPTKDKLYRVQIGAFSVYNNALNTLAKAKAAGFNDAFITEA